MHVFDNDLPPRTIATRLRSLNALHTILTAFHRLSNHLMNSSRRTRSPRYKCHSSSYQQYHLVSELQARSQPPHPLQAVDALCALEARDNTQGTLL